MANQITNKLIEEVDKGNFDFLDAQGNLILKEDGTPKIRNLGGAIWAKMEFLFITISSNMDKDPEVE